MNPDQISFMAQRAELIRLDAASRPAAAARPEAAAHDAAELVLRAGRALHGAGAPAHRLEAVLARLAAALRLPAEVFSTPTSLFLSLGDPASVHLARVRPSELDLSRLVRVDAVLREVTQRRLSARDGIAALDATEHARLLYPAWLDVLAFGVASASAARFLGGGLSELVASALAGTLVGVGAVVARRFAAVGKLFDAGAAFFVTGATALAARFVPLAHPIAIVSALIVLVPGLTLTVAMNELATGHWVSGTARLSAAASCFLSLAVGVALGTHLMPGVRTAAVQPLPAWTELAALAAAPLSFVVLFRARPADAPAIFAAGALAYAGARLGAAQLGPGPGGFLGAFVVGAASNLRARLSGVPALVTLVPGVMLLVPGSIGFSSVSAFLASDPASGVQAAFRAALVAASLVAGLLSSAVVAARHEL